MARLIDADEALLRNDKMKNRSDVFRSYAKVVIDGTPTIDAVPVVHGRWIVKGQDVFCSHCDKESGHNQWGASSFSAYCPNCGAKMDGGADNEID